MSAAELAVYDAMEPPVPEYEQGLRDGVESAVRRFAALRYNAASQHIHPVNEHQDETCFLRIDHIDAVLLELLVAAQS